MDNDPMLHADNIIVQSLERSTNGFWC